MDKLTKKYNEYKITMDIQQKYNNKDLKDVTISCSTCNKEISFNGVGCTYVKYINLLLMIN